MPQVGAWFAATWMGANGAVAAFALQTATSLAISAAAAKLTAPKGPRPQDLTNELRSSNAQRVRHLGRVRTSGAVMFWDWANVSAFTENPGGLGGAIAWKKGRRLFKLIAVAQGGMEDVHQWYLDGEPVEVNAQGFVTTEPWNKGNINLRFRKGIKGDEWDGGNWEVLRQAFPDQWTTDHKLRGVGTILASFDAVSGEDIADVYSGGEPEVSALISGAPQFVPMSGSYVQTRNATVLLGDLLTNPRYGPLDPADLDLALFSSARNRCAASVATAGGTRPRYRAGMSYALSDGLKDNAQKLLDAMGGRAWLTPEGKIGVQPGFWVEPTVTIEEHHIVEMDYGAGTEDINRVTTLVATYVAPEVNWQETTADPVDDDAAIARYGEGEPKSVDLLAVQHYGQAAHLCQQQLARLNPARSMTIKLRSSGLLLMGEQAANVNIPRIGLNNVPFWIDRFGWDGTNVTVDLSQADPNAIADIGVGDEGTPPAIPEEVDRGASDQGTTIDSVTVVTDDGAPYIRITGTADAYAGYWVFAQYRRSTSRPGGQWTNMIRETAPGGEYSYRTQPLADRVDYDVRTFVGATNGDDYVIKSTPVKVQDIDVVANGTAPDDPVVVSASGSVGGSLTVTFMPDLGANYRRTGLYRAGPAETFAEATHIKWSYDTSSDVTLTAAVPAAGARFWLQSENSSQVKSDSVLVGTYT